MMKSQIKAIIFDFGGVLVDWSPHNLYKNYFSSNEEIDAFLAEIDFYAWNAEQDRGRTVSEGVAILSAKFPHRAALIHAYADNWINSIAGIKPDVVELLYRLKAQDYAIYGLSNWSSETFQQVREQFAFLRNMDYLVLSGEVKMVKPEAGIFRYFLRHIPERAEECLFIDDSLPNIEAARALGIQGHHFRSAEALEKELKAFSLLSDSQFG